MNLTPPVPTNETRPLAKSTFWLVSSIPVAIHAIALWTIVIPLVFIGYYSLDDSLKTSSYFDIYSPITLASYFFTSSIFAIVGFYKRRNSHKYNVLLIVYIVLQTFFFVIGVALVGYALYVYSKFHSANPSVGMSPSDAIIGSVFATMALLALSFPLCLIVGRGLWVLIIKPPPLTDLEGKYLICKSCEYDLRGTPGKTCPECGASVMAVNKQPSR